VTLDVFSDVRRCFADELTNRRQAETLPHVQHHGWLRPLRPDVSIEAPVIFVGFGVTAPEQLYGTTTSNRCEGGKLWHCWPGA